MRKMTKDDKISLKEKRLAHLKTLNSDPEDIKYFETELKKLKGE